MVKAKTSGSYSSTDVYEDEIDLRDLLLVYGSGGN